MITSKTTEVLLWAFHDPRPIVCFILNLIVLRDGVGVSSEWVFWPITAASCPGGVYGALEFVCKSLLVTIVCRGGTTSGNNDASIRLDFFADLLEQRAVWRKRLVNEDFRVRGDTAPNTVPLREGMVPTNDEDINTVVAVLPAAQ